VRLEIDRDDLAEVLAVVSRILGSRLVTQVTGGLLIKMSPTGTALIASDQDLTVQASVAVPASDSGSLVVGGRVIHDVVRAMPAGKLEFESTPVGLTVTGGATRIELTAFVTDIYPVPAPIEGPSVTLEAAEFREALRQVLRSASTDPTRTIFTGVQIKQAEAGRIELVTTDTYRLAVRSASAGQRDAGTSTGSEGESANSENGMESIVIPSRLLSEVQRTLTPKHETVTIRFDSRSVELSFDNYTYHSPLLLGSFPDWKKLLPEVYPHKLIVSKSDILESLKRVRAMDREGGQSVRISSTGADITLHAARSEVGTVDDHIRSMTDEDCPNILFTPQYLNDGIEVAEGEIISIEYSDSSKPALITSQDRDTYKYLLMPIKTPA
jgi:DNA polymerase-3 subunit beta